MSNVIQIKSCVNASKALRNIADRLDSGDLEVDEVTVIVGTEIFQCGQFDEAKAVEGAIFSMTYGIHKIMNATMKASVDD